MTVTKFSGAINGNYPAVIPRATYTATTGSPNINTTARPGKTIINYTGSGSITIGSAGYVEVLVIGGGGGGGIYGGGGGGGLLYSTTTFLDSGTRTISIGAGGAAAVNPSNTYSGIPSAIGSTNTSGTNPASIIGIGGGAGALNTGSRFGLFGGSGGGGADGGGSGFSGQGNNGADGGGGGAGGAASGTTGGVGLALSVTGSSVTYAAGGNDTGGGAGTANSGNGANGASSGNPGGSGRVIIVIG
jgi:hypothetical protein